MDASKLNHLLYTNHYSPADLEEVRNLCRNYPMFSLAHMLKVRIMESLGHDTDRDLKHAAVFAPDRSSFHAFVTELSRPALEEDKVELLEEAEDKGILLTDEPNEEADQIIDQHAPYMASTGDDGLLELDEQTEEEAFVLDEEEPEEELTSETLIEAVAKDEVEMEEPVAEEEPTPAIDEVEADPESEEAPGERDLIREFIHEDPGPIRADKKTNLKGDVSTASIREHDGFITDTLARIYVKQGLYAKAIYAYEKLSLKYPEKSAYFAAQIEKVGNINHS